MNELKMGKMTSKEIAIWFGISYNTYKNNISKYQAKLQDYCRFTPIYGGVIIEEIYIHTYNKHLHRTAESAYLTELIEHNNLVSISGMVEEIPYTKYTLTKVRNYLFGDKPINIDPNNKGILGYREMIWAIKLGPNTYRKLTTAEEELFDVLITKLYANTPAESLKAQSLILDYCIKENLSAQSYKDLLTMNNLNFFSGVVSNFKDITGYQLATPTEHTIAIDFDKQLDTDTLEYRNRLLQEIDIIRKSKDNIEG